MGAVWPGRRTVTSPPYAVSAAAAAAASPGRVGARRSSAVGMWTFHAHLLAWVVVAAIGVAYLVAVRVYARRAARSSSVGRLPTAHQLLSLLAGLASLAVALTWPVADLAAHRSLTALIVQRLLLTLAAAAFLLLAMPAPLLASLTRPAALDAALRWVTQPVVAVVVFTVVAVGTLLTPVVTAQATSAPVRGAVDAALLVAGIVLWGPVLRHIPGASRPAAVGLAVYLFVQSVVPTFPAVIYVFARHPLYPTYATQHVFGLSPLADQQLAGIVAKLATIPVLWSVAWVALARAHRLDASGEDNEPLTWAEVQRQLERAARAEQRPGRARRHRALRPVAGALSPGAWSETSAPPASEPRPPDPRPRDQHPSAPPDTGRPGNEPRSPDG